jgi:thiamine pyrophosphokinase
VVGDADSLSAASVDALRADGVDVRIHPAQKDESDAELALRAALSAGATEILFVGAFGGQRVEHTIANLLLLTLPDLAGIDVTLIDGPSTVRVIGAGGGPGCADLAGERGDYVSLLPLRDAVDGVTTAGLTYPLVGATLRQGFTRGLSNELAADVGEVRTAKGLLAVVHTRRRAVEERR